MSELPEGYAGLRASEYEGRLKYIEVYLEAGRKVEPMVSGNLKGNVRMSVSALDVLRQTYERIHEMFESAVSERDVLVRDALVLEGTLRNGFSGSTRDILLKANESGALPLEAERLAFERPEVVYGALIDSIRGAVGGSSGGSGEGLGGEEGRGYEGGRGEGGEE